MSLLVQEPVVEGALLARPLHPPPLGSHAQVGQQGHAGGQGKGVQVALWKAFHVMMAS